jgi:hypothetical protein
MSRRFLSRNIEDGHACTGQQERTSEDFCDALTGDEIKAFQLIVFGQPLSDQELQQARPPPKTRYWVAVPRGMHPLRPNNVSSLRGPRPLPPCPPGLVCGSVG